MAADYTVLLAGDFSKKKTGGTFAIRERLRFK
jgi:hypothetical protein